eukprot:5325225-Amphidinium_carterae.2
MRAVRDRVVIDFACVSLLDLARSVDLVAQTNMREIGVRPVSWASCPKVALGLPVKNDPLFKSAPVQPYLRRGAAIVASVACSAACTAITRRRRRSSVWRFALGDQLFQDSLNQEIAKLKRGEKRAVDRAVVRQKPRYAAPPGTTLRTSGVLDVGEVSFAARLLSALCFVAPLVAAMPYGVSCFVHLPLLRSVVLKPLLPLVQMYHGMAV